MSSKEHIQLGWVVRWVLSTPPGHPAAGRYVRVVPVLPLLLCTRPARARPSVGGQSPTPAPRQLPWSPPRGPPNTLSVSSIWYFGLRASKSISSLSGDYSSASQPSAPPAHPLRHKPMNRVDQITRVLSDTASFRTLRSLALELLRERGYTGPRNRSLTQLLFGPVSRDTSLCESMFGVHKLAVCDLRRCVLCFLSPYLEILIPLSPRYEGKADPPFDAAARVRSRGTSGTAAHFASGFWTPGLCLSSSSCLSGCSKPISPVGWL